MHARTTSIIGMTLLLGGCSAWFAVDQNGNGQTSSTSSTVHSSVSSSLAANWETYESDDLGIAIDYPGEMNIEEGIERPTATAGANFNLWGPTQTADTEWFDGISVTIERGSFSGALRDFAMEQVESARNVGTIVEPLSNMTLAGRQGFTFTADTLGVYTTYVLPVGSQEYLMISSLSPDPTDQGFDEVVDQMLQSLEIR